MQSFCRKCDSIARCIAANRIWRVVQGPKISREVAWIHKVTINGWNPSANKKKSSD
jgi:hypothetical protein